MKELTFEQVEEVSGGVQGFPGLTGPLYLTERIRNYFEGGGGYFSTAGFIDATKGSYTDQCAAVRDFTTQEKAFLDAFFVFAGGLIGGVAGAAAAAYFQALITEGATGGCVPEVPDFMAP